VQVLVLVQVGEGRSMCEVGGGRRSGHVMKLQLLAQRAVCLIGGPSGQAHYTLPAAGFAGGFLEAVRFRGIPGSIKVYRNRLTRGCFRGTGLQIAREWRGANGLSNDGRKASSAGAQLQVVATGRDKHFRACLYCRVGVAAGGRDVVARQTTVVQVMSDWQREGCVRTS